MRNFGILLIKASIFFLVAAGASLSSFSMPIVKYVTEMKSLQYEVEENIGKSPSLEVCVPDVAKTSLAECKTALFMESTVEQVASQWAFWTNVILALGLILFFIGVIIFLRATFVERRKSQANE